MDIIDIILGAKLGGGGGGSGSEGSSSFIPSFGTIAYVDLGTTWAGNDPYTSTVTVTGYTVTDKTMVSVLPSTAVLTQMLSDGTTNIFITNNNGVLTATAHGAAPTYAMTLTVLCTESDQAAAIGNLPAIVGDGVLEVLGATDLTDAVNLLNTDVSDVKNAIDAKAPLIINTASGNIASFADGADGAQIRKIVGTIVPVQSGTGDPSPDNVRPISGWTGANITRTGKNIFDKTNVLTSCAIVDNKISDHATYDLYFVPLKENTTYTFIRPAGTSSYPQFGLSEEYPQIGTTVSNYISLRYQNPYTFNSGNYKYALFALYKSMGNECSVVIGSDSIPNTEPYYGQTLPINWQTEAGTIYGGTLTLNEDGSADVVSEWVQRDISEMSVAPPGGTNEPWVHRFQIRCWRNTPVSTWEQNYAKGLLATMFKEGNAYTNGTFERPNGYFYDNTISTADEFREKYAGMKLCYGIANAFITSYHFNNIGQLYTYFGTNNVWIDTGAITECDYPADTKLYFDGLTAPDEDMIANANIASGKYFVVNNQLYLSTAAIAAGASIVPGTNCTATNLAEALNALNT